MSLNDFNPVKFEFHYSCIIKEIYRKIVVDKSFVKQDLMQQVFVYPYSNTFLIKKNYDL